MSLMQNDVRAADAATLRTFYTDLAFTCGPSVIGKPTGIVEDD